jgi:endonuclease YncB( thermonuclease family)
MELASRILSVLLGAAVMVLLLWPVTIPLGFGEVWWASRQAHAPGTREEAPKPASASKPALAEPEPPPPAFQAQIKAAPPGGGSAIPKSQVAALDNADKTGTLGPQTASPHAATKVYRRVTVRDGGTLQAEGVVIRLAGLASREAEATCNDVQGKTWRCGAAAKAALTRLIRGRAVTCTLPKSGEHNIVARCSVGDTDLSAWVLRQGWAEPKDAEAPLAEGATAAKKERLGLWRDGD